MPRMKMIDAMTEAQEDKLYRTAYNTVERLLNRCGSFEAVNCVYVAVREAVIDRELWLKREEPLRRQIDELEKPLKRKRGRL